MTTIAPYLIITIQENEILVENIYYIRLHIHIITKNYLEHIHVYIHTNKIHKMDKFISKKVSNLQL